MSERIHDQEPDTSELTVRALLSAECPQWSALPMDYVRTSGTDNAMWRLRVERGEDLVVRLPRRPNAAEHVEQEMNLLRMLAEVPVSAALRTPSVHHVGEPNEAFPHRWAVLGWLGGVDAWTARDALDHDLDSIATDLATAVRAIRVRSDVPAPERSPGSRGGSIEPLVQRLNWWLDDPQWNAPQLIDVTAVRVSRPRHWSSPPNRS